MVMQTSKLVHFSVLCLAALGFVASSAESAEMFWKPISASGTHVVVGNEIRLTGGGQRVFLELRLSGWAPAALSTWQAVFDPTTLGQICVGGGNDGNACFSDFDCFGGGTCAAARPGPITPASEPCTLDSECIAAFGAGAACDTARGVCKPGWQDKTRLDFVIQDALSLVDTSTPFYRFGSSVLFGLPATDTGVIFYGGTLALDVPANAAGSYDVVISPSGGDTFMVSDTGSSIAPITITNAIITVLCQSSADCNDNNACTTDVCETNGTCTHTPNFDSVNFCCNPASGALVAINDGNDCTADVCAADGSVSHPPLPEFSACGDSTSTACDRADSCNATGVCVARSVANGTPCGNPSVSDCDGADTCDGAGICQPNLAPVGTACGNASSAQCDNPDSCNATGLCLPNHVPNGTACDDGLFCNVGEACAGGLCAGGAPRDCSDGLTCTTDVCNDTTDTCDSTLNTNNCLIAGTCFAEAEFNPANDCEWCASLTSTSMFTVRVDGSSCGIDAPCTIDQCAAGVCTHPPEPQGLACGNPNVSSCDLADTCDGAGICASNFVPGGTACGDPTTSQCDQADVCNGNGACVNNFIPNGTPCDDGNMCTNPDACQGGLCLSSNVPNGTACDDGLFCNVSEACTNGSCTGGSPRNCSDGFPCTTDVCNDTTDTCGSTLDANHCLIAGTCFADNELNPANDCESCDSLTSTSMFTALGDGTACGVDAPCTIDQCVSGACMHPPEPQGLPCGDPSVSECDLADTCSGTGLCARNFLPSGTACGDPTTTQCDLADTCDGGGACIVNFVPNGTACSDGEDVCTDPDACRNGICIGRIVPQAPDVIALGGLSIDITPLPADSAAPVALRLTSPDWPCIDLFLDANGSLVNTPVFLLPSEWGTVSVIGTQIAPDSVYDVVAECGAFASNAGSGSTWLFGDYDNNGAVDFNDISLSVNFFLGTVDLPLVLMDIAPCGGDGSGNFLDIRASVDAFLENPFPCPLPCP